MYQHGGDIYRNNVKLDFSINVNLLGMPKSVRKAARKAIFSCDFYPDSKCEELIDKIAAKTALSPAQIICGNGAAELIFALVAAYQPKKAIIPVPSFHEYEQALRSTDCEILHFVMEEKAGFTLNESFLDQIQKGIDLIFLCNPNNPTGFLLDQEFLLKILKKCEALEILLVVDECFLDFVTNQGEYSLISFVNQAKHLFILKAFTKTYAIPGLRLGYGMCGNLGLLLKMREKLQPWNVSIPAQKAGVAALMEQNYINKSIRILEKEKQYIKRELKKLSITVYDSRANYLFMKASPRLYEACIKDGIMIRDCSNYQGLQEGFYRIAIKRHQQNRYLIKVLKERIRWLNP